MSWTIETVGGLKRLLEPFADEMRIRPPLKFRYVSPLDKSAYLDQQLMDDTCHHKSEK